MILALKMAFQFPIPGLEFIHVNHSLKQKMVAFSLDYFTTEYATHKLRMEEFQAYRRATLFLTRKLM